MTGDIKELTLLIFPTSPAIINDVKLSTIRILKKNKISSISNYYGKKLFFYIYKENY